MELNLSIPTFTVFIQGLLSFFSPCVLPLVPLYMGYLSGGTQTTTPEGEVIYQRKTVMKNTLFFVFGVAFAFFLLGFGFTTLGTFFSGNQTLFARIGGILVVLFGLFQLGWLGGTPLDGEHRFHLNLQGMAINPLTALLLGFTFSFAWTPCVGPALTTVLLMASSAQTATWGYVLIGVYTLGFVLPFLAVGLFTTQLLNWFRTHRNWLQYTVKIGGVLMIVMGVMMFTGWMNGVTGYLSTWTLPTSTADTAPEATAEESTATAPTEEEQTAEQPEESSAQTEPEPEAETETETTVAALDFTLVDQFGETHTLSDYVGKTVFLNFWATWCSPCRSEMPDIQALYEEYGENTGDVIILGVVQPKTEENLYTQEGDVQYVTDFLSENSYTYPTVMDESGMITYQYGISAYPTTFMIDANGNVFGYIPGALDGDIMRQIIEITQESVTETPTS